MSYHLLTGGINHNFPETFSFLISGDPREQRISVKIFDMQKIFAHRLIGTVIVLLENLVDHFGPLEKEYMIEGSTAESYVGFKLQWSSY